MVEDIFSYFLTILCGAKDMADLAPRPPLLITTRWNDLLGRVLHHEITF
jgi:hypothetical protein